MNPQNIQNFNVLKYVLAVLGLIIGVILVIAFFPIVVIGAGERGVVFNSVNGVQDRILDEGIHFRIPVVESITKISVRVQKTDVKAEAASKDLQTVYTDIVVNWHMNAGKVNKIYQEVGDEEAIKDRILTPAVSEVVKAATAKKTAAEVLAQRPELKRDIDDALQKRLQSYDIVLDDVSIVNVNFTPEFNQAIEAKQIAQQQAEQAKFTAERAKNEAEATVNKAQGEAEANQLRQQSLTPQLLQQNAIEKWNGQFPQYFGGGVLPFLNIGQ